HRYITSSLTTVSSGGRADLCAYFLVRGTQLLSDGGHIGMITTNTVSQGDTREIGLEYLIKNGLTIYRAIPSRPWPGTASLEVALLWLTRSQWRGATFLNDVPTDSINSYLSLTTSLHYQPHRLEENKGLACEGSKPMGSGFILSPEEAASLTKQCESNREVLFPYLNGDDLTSSPEQSASRWVVNFFNWPEQRARTYSSCWKIIEDRVRPYRQEMDDKGNYIRRSPLPQRFWQYGDSRSDFYKRISGSSHILIAAQTSKYVTIDLVPTGQVFGQTVIMLAFSDFGNFALFTSALHAEWIIAHCSSLETRQRYIVSDGFDTFPRLRITSPGKDIGTQYCMTRKSVMTRCAMGLTELYNLIHDEAVSDQEIADLRSLQLEMDKAVAAAYGWSDLDLGHGFHETKQGMRFTISESARREVLARLLKLNHERYAEEVAQGLHNKKGKPKVTGRKGKRTPSDEESLLF